MDKEKVILLKRTRYSEADLILRGLNSQGSKVHLFARSALKSKKRFGGGVLEPFHYIEVTYQRRRPEELDKLRPISEATLLKDFAAIRSDYGRLQVGLFMLKTVDQWSKEGVPDGEAVFNLLGQSLKALEVAQNIQTLRLQFWAKLLWLQGVLDGAEGFRELLSRPVGEVDQIKMAPSAADQLERALSRIT